MRFIHPCIPRCRAPEQVSSVLAQSRFAATQRLINPPQRAVLTTVGTVYRHTPEKGADQVHSLATELQTKHPSRADHLDDLRSYWLG